MISLKNKKVLVFGLGVQGGGVATTNWLLKHGAKVTVTDLKTKKELARSLANIKGSVKLRLDGHDVNDIAKSDVVVINPDVPLTSDYVRFAFDQGKAVENEATLFYRYWQKPIIGVSGTRGKTTTSHWINHFLSAKFKSSVAGNSHDYPFLKVLDKQNRLDIAVTEMPSFHLELFDRTNLKPHTAVITNIYHDHFNRYSIYEKYVKAKSNLYVNQTDTDDLILNFDNRWTPALRARNIQPRLWYFSLKKIPERSRGLFFQYGYGVFHDNDNVKRALDLRTFANKWAIPPGSCF